MVSDVLSARPLPTPSPLVRLFRKIDRLGRALTLRAWRSPVRALDDWMEGESARDARWTLRDHPRYQIRFRTEARGQRIDCFVDYIASNDFLGLFCYVPIVFAPDRRAALLDLLDRLNGEVLFGSLGHHPEDGRVRFQYVIDAEGLRLSPAYVDLVVRHAEGALHGALPALMALSMRDEPVEALLRRTAS